MRGTDHQQSHIFSYLSPEMRVRKDHPLRSVRTMVDEVLRALSPQFDRDCRPRKARAIVGCNREAAPGARILPDCCAWITSEQLLMEEIDYSMLFRWFVRVKSGRGSVGSDGVHEEDRDRLLEAEVAKQFLAQVVEQARTKGLTFRTNTSRWMARCWKPGPGRRAFSARTRKNPPSSDDPGNPTVNFHGEKRSNRTHASKPIRRPSWHARARARRRS